MKQRSLRSGGYVGELARAGQPVSAAIEVHSSVIKEETDARARFLMSVLLMSVELASVTALCSSLMPQLRLIHWTESWTESGDGTVAAP